MPSPLEALQRRFVSAVAEGDGALAAAVRGGGRLSPAEAVAVYVRGYPARLTEALGETFQVCWRVLGDENFFAACRDYIAGHPSRSHNLSDYGSDFPACLGARPDSVQAPFLEDLARFEWAFKELFHKAPHDGLAAARLAAAAGPASRLRLGSASVLLALNHRVYGIWRRDRADDTPLRPRDWEGAERLLLYKAGSNPVFVRELPVPEHAALSALEKGLPLGEALAAADGLDEAGARTLFAFLAESGLIAAVAP
ncbi:MAG: putative DNA-binding domain-containing protein [Elusimicrobia bacterium]|nr:putative DNA-binding domain-containing protein [Elusimicrobiota bacterium]